MYNTDNYTVSMVSVHTLSICSSPTCSRILGGSVLRCTCCSSTIPHSRFCAMSAMTWTFSQLLGPAGTSLNTWALVLQSLVPIVDLNGTHTRSWPVRLTKVSSPRLQHYLRACNIVSGWYRCLLSTLAWSLWSTWHTRWQQGKSSHWYF